MSLNAGNGITLNSAGVVLTLDGKTLNNAVGSTAIWIGDFSQQGRIAFNNGAVFNNNGTFFARGDMNIFATSGAGIFNNAGTLRAIKITARSGSRPASSSTTAAR